MNERIKLQKQQPAQEAGNASSRKKALDYLASERKITLLFGAITATIVGAILYDKVPTAYILIWMAAVFAINILRWLQSSNYSQKTSPDVNMYYPKFILSIFAASCTWGMGILFFMTYLQPIHQASLIIIIVSLGGGACVKMPKDIFSFFLFGIATPSIIWMIFSNNLQTNHLGLLFVFSVLILWLATQQFNKSLYDAITTKLQNTALLKQMEIQSQALIQSDDGIIIMNHLGIVEYTNPAFLRISGYQEADILDQTASFLINTPKNTAHLKQLWKNINRGKSWSSRLLMPSQDKGSYPSLISLAPVYNHQQQLTHLVAIQKDLREHEKLEDQLYQAQKLEALGTLTSGIAHDFNNIITGITGSAFLLKRNTQAGDPNILHIHRLEKLGKIATDLIARLLAFSRKEALQLEATHLQTCIQEALCLYLPSLPAHITVHQSINHTDVHVNMDSTMFQQVLNNIINNAVDAMAHVADASLRITLQSHNLPSHNTMPAEQPYARISIEDNGIGIPSDVLEHIFEPFFTTKDSTQGTGLGLAMAYRTVQSHRGALSVDSTVGQGTTFHIDLPIL